MRHSLSLRRQAQWCWYGSARLKRQMMRSRPVSGGFFFSDGVHTLRVGIIGHGHMGGALARGLQKYPDRIEVLTTRKGGDNVSLVLWSDVVLLCVKPSAVEEIMREIAPHLVEDRVIVSVAIGISLEALRAWCDDRCAVIRAMPNMPSRIGLGMTALATTTTTNALTAKGVQMLFDLVGRTCWIDEEHFDTVTALSGCGPAYGYLIIEALTDAGAKLGLVRTTSQLLVAQALLGSAEMVLQSDLHPAVLRDEVATPAGCTIEAITQLEQSGLRVALSKAVAAAANRCVALSKPRG
jgi:pyrroline-5-carboxylate reductase